MKVIHFYLYMQSLCVLVMFLFALNYNSINVFVSILLLICAIYEGLKLWVTYDGEVPPIGYNKIQLIQKIFFNKVWFIISVSLIYGVMVISPVASFLGLVMIATIQYMSDVNIPFYRT